MAKNWGSLNTPLDRIGLTHQLGYMDLFRCNAETMKQKKRNAIKWHMQRLTTRRQQFKSNFSRFLLFTIWDGKNL